MDDPGGEDMGLARPRSGDDEKGTGAMLDREPLFRLEPLEDVGPRFAQPKTELFGHGRNLSGTDRGPPRGGAPAGGRGVRRRVKRVSVGPSLSLEIA